MKLLAVILLTLFLTGCITTKSATDDRNKSGWVMASTEPIIPQLYYMEVYTPHDGLITCFITNSSTSVFCVR